MNFRKNQKQNQIAQQFATGVWMVDSKKQLRKQTIDSLVTAHR